MTDGTVRAMGMEMREVADRVAAVVAQLAGHTAADADEERSMSVLLAEIDRLVANGADPFEQEHDPVHITGSAIVIGPRGTVLLEHRRLGMWLQPGGHVDAGETPWDAALREAAEETGLAVAFTGGSATLVHVDVHAGGRGHTHLDLRYLIDGGTADPSPPPEESQMVAWFAWADATERAGDPRLAALLGRLGAELG